MTLMIAAAMLVFLAHASQAQPENRLGLAVHYWKTIDKIEVDNIDENGVAWIITYQRVSGSLITLEADLEFLPRGYAASEHRVTAPQVYAIAGRGVYGGLGLGIYYSDGDFADKPFFALRAGVNFEIMPALYLDINANYRFDEWDLGQVQENIDTDTMTLGAAVRMRL